MTFEGYAAFRSAGLRGSSAAYTDLEALHEQHLKERQQRQRQEQEEEEAHHRELADLAMNGSFVSSLLVPKVRGKTSHPAVWRCVLFNPTT